MNCGSLVKAYTTKNPSEAEVVLLALEAAGILATLSGERQAGLTGAIDIDVMVRAEDARRAQEFLAEHRAFPVSDQEVEQAELESEEKGGGEDQPEAR